MARGIENVEFEFGEALEAGAGLELVDRPRAHRSPTGSSAVHRPSKRSEIWPSSHGEIEIGETEVVLEPLEKGGLKDAAAAIEGVAGQPDQFGLVEAQLPRGFQLLAQLVDIDDLAQAARPRCG